MKEVTREDFHKIMVKEGNKFLEVLVNDETSPEEDVVLILALASLSVRLEKRLFS